MRRLWFVFLLILLLAACGSEENEQENQTATPRPASAVTLDPDLGNVIAGCVTADLENWYESVSTSVQIFQERAIALAGIVNMDISAGIEELIMLQDTVRATPIPECMMFQHQTALDNMALTLAHFNSFLSGVISATDLQQKVVEQNTKYYTDVKPLFDTALQALNERLQQGQ